MQDQSLDSLLENLSPRLNRGEFVFCTIGNESDFNLADSIAAGNVLGTFVEAEGTTLILPTQTAADAGLHFEAVLGWITLDVDSSLEAVGLTARVATALADEGIAANVVAAHFHDHLFVPHKDTDRAMQVLQNLARSAVERRTGK